MPYTRLDRLPLLSALSEYFGIRDDEEDSTGFCISADRMVTRRALFSDLMTQLMSISPSQTQNILRGLAAYKKATQTPRSLHFASIEAYVDFRFDDFGAEFFLACTMFGMDMDPLSDAERAIIEPCIQLAYRATALINDFYSFDVDFASLDAAAHVVNGVLVLIEMQGLSVESAKDSLRQIAIEYDQKFIRLKQRAGASSRLSLRLEELLEALESQIIGNAVWSSTALRYGHGNNATGRLYDSHSLDLGTDSLSIG